MTPYTVICDSCHGRKFCDRIVCQKCGGDGVIIISDEPPTALTRKGLRTALIAVLVILVVMGIIIYLTKGET